MREVLLALGVASDTANDYLLMVFPQLSANQELTFPPMDAPQHELSLRGFNMSTFHKYKEVEHHNSFNETNFEQT